MVETLEVVPEGQQGRVCSGFDWASGTSLPSDLDGVPVEDRGVRTWACLGCRAGVLVHQFGTPGQDFFISFSSLPSQKRSIRTYADKSLFFCLHLAKFSRGEFSAA